MTMRHVPCVLLSAVANLIAILPLSSAADHKASSLADLHSACAYYAMSQIQGQILDISFGVEPTANSSSSSVSITHSHQQHNHQQPDAPIYRSCHVRVFNNGIINTLSFNIYHADETTAYSPEHIADLKNDAENSKTTTTEATETTTKTLAPPSVSHKSNTITSDEIKSPSRSTTQEKTTRTTSLTE